MLPAHVQQDVAIPDLRNMINAFAEFIRLDVANGDASADTLRGYYSQMVQFVQWCHDIAHVHPAAVTADHVRAYRRYLVDAGYMPGTIAHKLAVVRRFYDAAQAAGLRRDNPANGCRPPRNRAAADDMPYLTEDELRRLLATVPRDGSEASLRDLALLAFLALQARRQIEAHRANVDDIRPDGAMIVRGKYHDTVIQLRRDVLAVLEQYIAKRQRVTPDELGTPLFVAVGNRAGGQRLSRRGIRKIIDEYLAKAGLKRPKLSGHALRHSAATAMYRATRDLRAVQAILGHRDPKTTARYARAVERQERNIAETICIEL